jgi:hypothetical protein
VKARLRSFGSTEGKFSCSCLRRTTSIFP